MDHHKTSPDAWHYRILRRSDRSPPQSANSSRNRSMLSRQPPGDQTRRDRMQIPEAASGLTGGATAVTCDAAVTQSAWQCSMTTFDAHRETASAQSATFIHLKSDSDPQNTEKSLNINILGKKNSVINTVLHYFRYPKSLSNIVIKLKCSFYCVQSRQ